MTRSPLDALSELDRFYHTFGRAFAEWGGVEYYLSLLFAHASGLDYLAAQQIFFSSRSSRSRRDMLQAALVHSILASDWCEFVDRVIRKLPAYEGFRNRLAHCAMHPNALDENGMP